jgi:hypothetical protein
LQVASRRDVGCGFEIERLTFDVLDLALATTSQGQVSTGDGRKRVKLFLFLQSDFLAEGGVPCAKN